MKISRWFSLPQSLLIRPIELVPTEHTQSHQHQRVRPVGPGNQYGDICGGNSTAGGKTNGGGGGGGGGGTASATSSATGPVPKKRAVKRVIEMKKISDRAGGIGDYLGPCRSLINEVKCGIPTLLADLDPDMSDATDDLIVVELRSIKGTSGWLDDRSLEGVLVGDEVLPMSALRQLVQSRVRMTGSHGRRVSKSVYGVCNPPDCGQLLITLVPVVDLLQMIRDVGEVLQSKSMS